MYCASLSLLCDSVQALPKQTTEEWRVRKRAEGGDERTTAWMDGDIWEER